MLQIEQGKLVAYNGRDTILSIPEGVHTIGTGALKGMASLEEVYLPDTVSVIESDAFKGCRKLQKINFPSSLISIGAFAFHRCHSLREISLPPSITHLPDCVFLYNDSLTKLSIPGVKTLGRQVFLNNVNLTELVICTDLTISQICDVFTGCSKIHQIELSDGKKFVLDQLFDALLPTSPVPEVVRAIVRDIFRMMEFEKRTLVRFLTNLRQVELPEGIEQLGTGCFFDKRGIIGVKLPKSLKVIGSKAFRNCISLERIELPSSDFMIQPDAFKNCTSLKYVLYNGIEYEFVGVNKIISQSDSIPDLIHTIHTQILSNFLFCGTTLISYRGSESRVTVPNGITHIAPRAFAGKEEIDRILLPDSVEEIGEEAFSDCLLLQTILLPKRLKVLGKAAFFNCVKLIRVCLPDEIHSIAASVFNRCRSLTEVTFSSQLSEIGEMAFYGCRSLKQFSIPEQLKRLGSLAFYQCSSLIQIELPASIEHLGSNVFTASGVHNAVISCDPIEYGSNIFSQCQRLKHLIFEEGIRFIGDKFAFQCTHLSHVVFPNSLCQIGRNAFEGSPFLEKETVSGQIGSFLLDGSSFSGEVHLSEGITSIAGGAFYGNDAITHVTLPNSLKSIGSRAFCSCSSLKSIYIPENITELTEGIFAYCSNLQSVEISGCIRSIGDWAFYQCKQFSGLDQNSQSIAKTALHIGAEAFFSCLSMYHFETDTEDIGTDAIRETAFWKNLKQTSPFVIFSHTLLDGMSAFGEIEIPDGIQTIAPYAFAGNTNITSVVFPTSLKHIEKNAFCGCSSIIKLSFPSSFIELDPYCFSKCIKITQLSCQTKLLSKGAFSFCTNLKEVLLLSTVQLEAETFFGCTFLNRLEIPSVIEIGEQCFSGCSSLSELSLTHVKYIGTKAFEHCDCLKILSLSSEVILKDYAFLDCGRLSTLILPSIKKSNFRISYSVFSGCTWLQTIFSGQNKYLFHSYQDLFYDEFPIFIREIFMSAISCFFVNENFSIIAYQNNGTILRIPEGIQKIEGNVFQDVMNLEEISFPESLTYIGPRAFTGTKWLTIQREKTPFVIVHGILLDAASSRGVVKIPDHVHLISGWAFANCFDLTELILSSKTTWIEEFAFRNCINLHQITDQSTSNVYELRAISDQNRELSPWILRIFHDCYNCFKMASNGLLEECTGNISDMVLPEGIITLGKGVFEDGNLLTRIQLAKSTQFIEERTFAGCKWLTFVSGSSSLKRIGKQAFAGCICLEEIQDCKELEELGMGAFENCTALKRFFIPEGISTLPDRIFYRCHNLEEVILPSTLEKIGTEAFAFCYSLKTIQLPKGIKFIGERAFAWCDCILEMN